ncbi:hypothetical protein [Meiothermus hypogaeus]|uniref:Phage tail protein n=2 Tax=Meiothermus hypogaeus TaxID=884155 RepID=A0A511QWV0_9DEIN|nr:hypothetical protein [Meiothermus hypogaeus]RIH79212.1 hypothetical protein Mhypo_01210 [Meiothermus hypogaeus]GEM81858.1 hypothetical protein MHY01S_00240 [Meiothermus hypogaeus NBRC 106114]
MAITVRNGKVYDNSSIQLDLDGERIPVNVELEYNTGEVSEEYIYAGGKPVGRTPGQMAPADVTIKMPVDQWHQFRAKLGAKYKRKSFNATVTFVDTEDNVIIDKLNDLRILNDALSASPGAEALMAELTCKALDVVPGDLATF